MEKDIKKIRMKHIITVLALLLCTVFLSSSVKAAQTTQNPNDKKTGYHLEVYKTENRSVTADKAVDIYCAGSGLNPTDGELRSNVINKTNMKYSTRVEDYTAGGINDNVTHRRLILVLDDGREYALASPYVDAYSGWAGYAYFIERFTYVKDIGQWCFVGTAHYWLGTTNGNVGTPEEKDTVYNYTYTLYQFVANKYTVNYNGNGADSGSVKSQSCTYDTAFSLRGNNFVRTGYTFTGWNTKSDGSGISYSLNQSVKNLTSANGGKVTLYAQWQVNSGTIYYNSNGGVISDAPHYDANHTMYYTLDSMGSGMVFQSPSIYQSYTYVNNTFNYTKSSEMNLFNYGTFHLTRMGYHINPGQEWAYGGYVFNQDSSDPSCPVLNGLKSLLNLSNASGGSVTLYANWKPNTYNIVYDGNGATGGSVATQSASYDVPIAISNNGFTRTGYKFIGWKTKEGTPYTEGQVVQNLTTDNYGTVTLYAQWKAVNYTIHFDGNGATEGSMNDVIATVDVELNLPTYGFKRTTEQGVSKFLGWSTNKDSVSADYINQAKVINLTNQPNTTVTLYAIWDDCPSIHATDLYYTLQEAQTGTITETELLSHATAYDRELKSTANPSGEVSRGVNSTDHTSFIVADYIPEDFTSFTSDGSVTETYQVTDRVGNVTSEMITVHIVDSSAKDVNDGRVRFISKDHLDTLSNDSIWKVDSEYNAELTSVLNNHRENVKVFHGQALGQSVCIEKPGTGTWTLEPEQIWQFSYQDVLAVQNYIDVHGFGNIQEGNALEKFMREFSRNKVQ